LPKFLIEREIPGAGKLSSDELRTVATRSNAVLADMAPRAQWVHSYVTGDKIYCVYVADDEEAVLEHARRGGFPANSVSQVTATIDPTTADDGRA
jgi:Nickel responsive protein SCO4226-like